MNEMDIRTLESKKIYVQYRDTINPYSPIADRKYTITHSDKSGDLYVYVANDYAEDKVIELRDELRATWEYYDNDLALIGKVLIDGDEIKGNSELRNTIFVNEIHKAIEALRYGDRFLFDNNPELDNKKIYIYFISNDPKYNQFYDYGTIGMYRI